MAVGEDQLTRTPERERILAWRASEFVRLGFDLSEAEKLAQSDADLELARKLSNSQCPLSLIARIA